MLLELHLLTLNQIIGGLKQYKYNARCRKLNRCKLLLLVIKKLEEAATLLSQAKEVKENEECEL